MTDRAQDTEAIRAALSALADAATAGATTAYPAGSPPEFSTLMAKTNAAYSDGLAALRGLVARLEAAEQALAFYADPVTYFGVGIAGDEPTGGFMEDIDEVPWPDGGTNWKPGKRARAALAAAAPGETTVTHGRHCPCSACAREDWTRITGPCGMHGSDCPAVYAPAAPGETEQTP